MKNFYYILIILSVFVFYLLLPLFYSKNIVLASNTFSDNFDDGNLDGWILANDLEATPCANPWTVQNGMAGMIINNQSCTTNLIPSDSLWNNLGDNYDFDLDMKFVNGTDHNIAFRFTSATLSNNWYELHFQTPGDFSLGRFSPGIYNSFVVGNYQNGSTYHIKIRVINNNVKVYINNNLVRDYTSTVDRFPQGRIALRAGSGADPSSETWFDNIVVTSIDTPPVTDINLAVPLLKQTDPLWGGNIYDSANSWSKNSPGINAWGCAITSAAMVFNYHGITKLPDNKLLNPGTLNDWLKSQKDGYVNGGLVNWLSLTRLSRLAKAKNPAFLFDALEYKRINLANLAQLKTDLQNNIPGILQVPGHFIVAKGILNNIFTINDPYYNRTDLSSYSNTFLTLGRFIPSHTDLSYILISTTQNIDFHITDQAGNLAGDQTEDTVINPVTGQANTVKSWYVEQPPTGQYSVIISSDSDTPYILQTMLYDKNGEVVTQNFSGITHLDTEDEIALILNKDDATQSSSSANYNLDTLRATVDSLYAMHLITKPWVYKDFLRQIDMAEKLAEKKEHKKDGRQVLERLLKDSDLRDISKTVLEPGRTTLITQIEYIISHWQTVL